MGGIRILRAGWTVRELQEHLNRDDWRIATVSAGITSMDRDKRWERVRKGLSDAMVVNKVGTKATDALVSWSSPMRRVSRGRAHPADGDRRPDPAAAGEDKDGTLPLFQFPHGPVPEITEVLTQLDIPEQEKKPDTVHVYR